MKEKNMRPILLALVLVALLVPMAAFAAQTPTNATPVAAAQAISEDLPTTAASVDAGEACSAPVRQETAATAELCPFGSPTCVEHDDCDEYCGSPDFGYCDIRGFFPTGCCLCLG